MLWIFLESTNESTIGLPYFVMKISISCDFWHQISVLSPFEMFSLFGIGLCWVYFRGFGKMTNDNPKLPIDTYPKGLRMPKI